MMKVAIVHDWLNGMRGGEKVLEDLLEIFPDADLFTLFYEPDRISAAINQRPVQVSALQHLPFTRRHYRLLLPLFPWAIKRFDLAGYDLVLSSSHCAAKGVRAPEGVPHICYCYSPMRYLWDLYETYFGGERRRSLSGLAMPLFKKRLRRWDVETAQRVDLFVAISQHIAEKIKRCYDREALVVYPPVDVERFRIDSIGPGDYFLVVSALTPYKMVDVAVRAFNQLAQGGDWRLVIAGSGPEEARLRQLAGPQVELRGWVSDDELVGLYAGCRALIMPGPEDFGIAPLEAMASGRPVIALGQGGACETVVAGETGVLFDEPTVASLKNAIETFKPEVYNPSTLRDHAAKFGRERFRTELKAVIDDFLQRETAPVL
jgi:glycosyltransferase involved in cell wall biosynthesis